MKQWIIVLVILTIPIGAFFSTRDFLARSLWGKYSNAELAQVFAWRDQELFFELGNYYFDGGFSPGEGVYQLDKAKEMYKRAIDLNHDLLWSHYQLARIYFVEGDFQNALEEINEEMSVHPENVRSHYIRGLIYGYRKHFGDLEKAEADFRTFVSWAPTEWAGYNDWVWVLAQQNEYEKIKEVLKLAFLNVPSAETNPWLWNNHGVASLALKEYKSAQEFFKKAKELAENLTFDEWRKAYPGNNPREAEIGLVQFRKAIQANIKAAEKSL